MVAASFPFILQLRRKNDNGRNIFEPFFSISNESHCFERRKCEFVRWIIPNAVIRCFVFAISSASSSYSCYICVEMGIQSSILEALNERRLKRNWICWWELLNGCALFEHYKWPTFLGHNCSEEPWKCVLTFLNDMVFCASNDFKGL